jgi:hypothetical protein
VIEDAASPGDEDAPPAIIRLRKVLKVLLRAMGFRCISAAEARGDRGGQKGPEAPAQIGEAGPDDGRLHPTPPAV